MINSAVIFGYREGLKVLESEESVFETTTIFACFYTCNKNFLWKIKKAPANFYNL